jgi:Ser/Thr protein kinase RdoA (MazF antagonist)
MWLCVFGVAARSVTHDLVNSSRSFHTDWTDQVNDAALDDEVLLPSGCLTKGVVRVGDTVRRPLKLSSPLMARLLAHLERSGCKWAPRHLGVDARRRDILTYMPGDVPAKWGHFADAQLHRAASIVRELHEVTRASTLAPDAVICHNDPGPNNFVFRNHMPVALIDFDMAEPGDPLEDVGYMAWSWCISSKPARGPVTAQAAQVRILADAFRLTVADRERLPDHIVERFNRNIRFWFEHLSAPDNTLRSGPEILEIIEWSKRELRYTEAHRKNFLNALLE